jgi:hypothetical protein
MSSEAGGSLWSVMHNESNLLYSATMSLDGFIAGVDARMAVRFGPRRCLRKQDDAH